MEIYAQHDRVEIKLGVVADLVLIVYSEDVTDNHIFGVTPSFIGRQDGYNR